MSEHRLPFLRPLDPSNLYGHLAATAVPGVEEWGAGAYRAAVRLPHGPAVVEVGLPLGGVLPVTLRCTEPADEAEALHRVRRTFDLDVDPEAVRATLSADPAIAGLVAAAPGRRVPGTLDPEAMVLRAVLGQQVSTAAARTHAARLVAAFGERLPHPDGGLTHLFPRAAALVADPERVAAVVKVPRSRVRTLLAVASALVDGSVDLTAPRRSSARRCSPSRASGPGRRTRCSCGRWATRTRSCPRTSASSSPRADSGSPTRHGRSKRDRAPGRRTAPTPSSTSGRRACTR